MSETQVLMSGLAFPESPRWHEGRMWFADWIAHEVIAVDLEGESEVVARDPSLPLSIDFLADGRLLLVAGRRILRMEPDGSPAVHADLSGLSALGWNEIVVDGRANAYVNTAGFDLMAGAAFAPGVVALVTPDGASRQVAGDVAFPNGMVVTPDNATLILAESYANRLTAFDIAPDGGLSSRRVWAGLGDGVPDGICLDADGAVWYADVPNHRCVRVREGGEVLRTIDLDRGCFACMLSRDEGTLFVVTNEWILWADRSAIHAPIGLLWSILAGALGADTSVLSKATFGRLVLDRVEGGLWNTLLGSFRPLIGALFGAAFYTLINAGFLPITVSSGGNQIALYASVAFLAGFSHRWAQDSLKAAEAKVPAPPGPQESGGS